MRWRAYELPACGRAFDARVLLFAELDTPAGRLAVFSAHTSDDACQTRAVAELVRVSAGSLPRRADGGLQRDRDVAGGAGC